MHFLLMRENRWPAKQKGAPWKTPFTKREYAGKYTHGFTLFIKRIGDLYSRELRELVMECLMVEPDDRPTPLDLQKRVAAGYEIARKASESQGLFDNDQNPPIIEGLRLEP